MNCSLVLACLYTDGDDKTSDRIVSIIAQYFGLSNTVLSEFDDEIDKKRKGTQHEKK